MGPLALVVLATALNPVRLVAPSFSASGVDRGVARAWADYVVRELTKADIVVQTEGDIVAALGAERQRQLMGCSDESCLAEIAGALNSDGLLVGSVAAAGETRIINLRVVSKTGQPLAVASGTAANDAAMTSELRTLAEELVDQLRAKLPERFRDGNEGRLRRRHALIPVIVGVVVGGVGGGLLGVAVGTESGIRYSTTPYAGLAEVNTAISTGRTFELAGWAMVAVGCVALATALVVFIVGAP